MGSIVRYVGGIMQFTTGLASFWDGYTQLKANTQFMDIYFRFFDLPNALYTGSDPVPASSPLDTELQDVSFRYPGAENDVLRHFSCKLEPAGTMPS